MVTSYVLINSDLGTEKEVMDKLKDLDSVKEVYQTSGVYDVVAKLEAESNKKLRDVIIWQIRKLDNVRAAMTLVETDHYKRMQN